MITYRAGRSRIEISTLGAPFARVAHPCGCETTIASDSREERATLTVMPSVTFCRTGHPLLPVRDVPTDGNALLWTMLHATMSDPTARLHSVGVK